MLHGATGDGAGVMDEAGGGSGERGCGTDHPYKPWLLLSTASWSGGMVALATNCCRSHANPPPPGQSGAAIGALLLLFRELGLASVSRRWLKNQRAMQSEFAWVLIIFRFSQSEAAKRVTRVLGGATTGKESAVQGRGAGWRSKLAAGAARPSSGGRALGQRTG